MTEKILTLTGLSFRMEDKTIAHGVIIGGAKASLTDSLADGTVLMGRLTAKKDCPRGRFAACFAGMENQQILFCGDRFLLSDEEEQNVSFFAPLRRLIAR